MGEMRERMLRGELYIADDAENAAEFGRTQELLARFNGTPPAAWDERDALLRQMLRHVGVGVTVRPPFFCEYGAVSIGDKTFVNVDAVMLDVLPIAIGAYCQIATRVQLLTATHPIDPEPRRIGWEYAEPITIEDNVWLGGGAIVCPGVTIGQNTVVRRRRGRDEDPPSRRRRRRRPSPRPARDRRARPRRGADELNWSAPTGSCLHNTKNATSREPEDRAAPPKPTAGLEPATPSLRVKCSTN